MDKLLKYLLENKDILEAETPETPDEDYTIEEEDPDVFEDDGEDLTTEEAAEDPAASNVPQPEEANKPEPEEPKKRYIGQAGDNHYYIEPKEDGFVITDQLGTEKLTSKEAGVDNELDLILAARGELKLTTWTDEAMIKYFIPKIKEKESDTTEMEMSRPDLMEEPETPTETPEDIPMEETEETEEEEDTEAPSDEEDIFMEPEESLPESKKEKTASFSYKGKQISIKLIENKTDSNSVFQIGENKYKFSPTITDEYRVGGNFTDKSLSDFGKFIYSTIAG